MAAAAAVLKIERAHQMYRDGQHRDALVFYTEALAMAKTRAQKIALHSNRAACYLKLHDFKKAAEECTSVLELDYQHTGALMLRAQTLVTLKEYHSALFDVNRLMELNPSSDVYKNLQARLRTQLSLAPIPESEEESLGLEEDEDTEEEEQKQESALEDNLEKKSETAGGESQPGMAQKENIKNGLNKKFDSSKGESGDALVRMQNGNDGFCKKNEFPGAKPEVKLVQPQLVEENIEVSKARGSVEQLQNVQKKEMAFSKACRQVGQVENVHKKDTEFSKARESVGNVQIVKKSAEVQTKAWEAIPKPKGHLRLDYSRWDQVADDSSDEEEEEEEDQQPQYRFRVRTVGVRPVK